MAPTVIGADFKITGHAVSNGAVQVDGEIEGDIECASLTVGETAKVTGNVIAQDISVQGKVMGSIRGTNVTLQSSAHIEGDVYHQSLAIEQGAFFEGKSRRSENPIAEAAKTSERTAGFELGGSATAAPMSNGTSTGPGNKTTNGTSRSTPS
ncbi:MAG: bactofilin family protein [Hyphomicrobiaceae bacterium]